MSRSAPPRRAAAPLARRVGLPLAALAASLAPPAAAAPPTLDEIRAGVNRQWGVVRSLAVDYEMAQELAQPAAAVKRYTWNAITIKRAESFAFKGDKRYYKFDGPASAKDIAPKVEHDYDIIPGAKQVRADLERHYARVLAPGDRPPTLQPVHDFLPWKELAYNGRNVIQSQPGQLTALLKPDQLRGYAKNFAHEYLEDIARALPDPIDKAEDRKALRVPDMFDQGGFAVRPEPEEVDGSPCAVVSRAGRETLWMDPKINYGVRKYEILFEGTPYLKSRRVNREWKEYAPGVWLPRVSAREECGPPLAPEPYRGQPLFRTVYTVKALSVNDVPDSRFELSIEPGTTVVDATRLPGKGGDNQYVSYKMPADPGQLDKVAEKALAQREAGDRGQTSGVSGWTFFVGLNVAVIAVVVTLVVLRGRAKPGEPTG